MRPGHGAVGIALALTRLYVAAGTSCCLDAALETAEYEDAVYSADARPDGDCPTPVR